MDFFLRILRTLENSFKQLRLQKLTDAFLATMSKYAGGLSAEQKKNWEELLAKAYADMKKWGWY